MNHKIRKPLKKALKSEKEISVSTFINGELQTHFEGCKVLEATRNKFVILVDGDKKAEFYFSFLNGKISIKRNEIRVNWSPSETTVISL